MEPASAGKLEGVPGDLPVSQHDPALNGVQVRSIKHNQRTAALDFLLFAESAGQAAIMKARVIRPVILELPPEDGVVEPLGLLEIDGRKLDIVDAPVVGGVHRRIV